jgi:putative SOS response-associated peptidase YedK
VCGRYTLTKKQLRFASRFSREELQLFLQQRYNIAPTQNVPVIHIVAGNLVTEEMRWGLQPMWSKAPIINAQCEAILEKPTFCRSALERRCLMPADGFYEWQGKTPIHFTLPDGEPFYLAAIADEWKTPEKTVQCCCIITTAANDVVAPYHKRMPFIVAPGDRDRWLDPATNAADIEELFRRPDGTQLETRRVAPLVPDGEPRVPKLEQREFF